MDRQIRMLMLLPHLGGGGAEHVSALLAAHLDPAKVQVTLALVTEDLAGASVLPRRVSIRRLGMRRIRHAALAILITVWQERAQVIFSSMAHLSFLLLILRWLMPRETRLILRQNGTASQAVRGGAAGLVDRHLYRWLYPKANVIICQSRAMARDLEAQFGLKPDKLVVLANPVPVEEIRSHVAKIREQHKGRVAGPGTPVRLLAVGRLSFEKGVDLLLEAVSRLVAHKRLRPIDFDLQILGIGPEEDSLCEQAQRLRLGERVKFHGHRTDVRNFLAEADIFVLPSRHEGMPNALLEAAAAGLGLVATSCCEGVVEVVGRTGLPGVWLAETASAEALAQAIASAIAAVKENRTHRFEHTFVDQFSLPRSVEAYESLILDVASRPAR